MAEAELKGRALDIAIAKALGYTVYHYDKDVSENCYYQLWDADGETALWKRPHESARKTEAEAWNDVPAFSDDLNAMHEVEAEIERRELSERYVSRLFYVIDPTGGFVMNERWSLTHATAEQRAHAALDVLTQVKESK